LIVDKAVRSAGIGCAPPHLQVPCRNILDCHSRGDLQACRGRADGAPTSLCRMVSGLVIRHGIRSAVLTNELFDNIAIAGVIHAMKQSLIVTKR
jgi:hypothetical protein